MSTLVLLGFACAAAIGWGWVRGDRGQAAPHWLDRVPRRPGWPQATIELAEKIPLRFPLDLLPVIPGGSIVASVSRSSGYRMIGIEIATDQVAKARVFYEEALGQRGTMSVRSEETAHTRSWIASQGADGWFVEATVQERPDHGVSFVLLKATPESLRTAGPLRRLQLRVQRAWLWANGQPD